MPTPTRPPTQPGVDTRASLGTYQSWALAGSNEAFFKPVLDILLCQGCARRALFCSKWRLNTSNPGERSLGHCWQWGNLISLHFRSLQWLQVTLSKGHQIKARLKSRLLAEQTKLVSTQRSLNKSQISFNTPQGLKAVPDSLTPSLLEHPWLERCNILISFSMWVVALLAL